MVSVLETNELYLALMLELHLRSIFTGTAAPSQEDVHLKCHFKAVNTRGDNSCTHKNMGRETL